MNSEYTQVTMEERESDKEAITHPGGMQEKEIRRLQQETQVLELIAYSLLSIVGVFSLFAALGVDFGTSFDKAPLLLLLTSCSSLTYMTRKNKLARLEASASALNDRTGR